MVLSNDKKRREFIADPANWEPLASADNFVRMSKLMYKGNMWLKLEVWQTSNHWDYQQKKLVEVTGWELIRYYKINEHTHALNYGISPTQIADEIKEIDKKEKEA